MSVIGVLTAGGDCPGLNAVIRGVAGRAHARGDSEVVGILNGWEGLMDGRTMPLTRDDVRGILGRGGTMLGTSRKDPFVHGDGYESVAAHPGGQRPRRRRGDRRRRHAAHRPAPRRGRLPGGRGPQDHRQRHRRHRLHLRLRHRRADRHRRHRPPGDHRRGAQPGHPRGGHGPHPRLDRHLRRPRRRRRRHPHPRVPGAPGRGGHGAAPPPPPRARLLHRRGGRRGRAPGQGGARQGHLRLRPPRRRGLPDRPRSWRS